VVLRAALLREPPMLRLKLVPLKTVSSRNLRVRRTKVALAISFKP
jgi:hypothetical protein